MFDSFPVIPGSEATKDLWFSRRVSRPGVLKASGSKVSFRRGNTALRPERSLFEVPYSPVA